MFRNINELLTFLTILAAFISAVFYFGKMIFNINKESFSLSKMMLNFFDNEDE